MTVCAIQSLKYVSFSICHTINVPAIIQFQIATYHVYKFFHIFFISPSVRHFSYQISGRARLFHTKTFPRNSNINTCSLQDCPRTVCHILQSFTLLLLLNVGIFDKETAGAEYKILIKYTTTC